jgi:iron complex transport system ATP-binding protein
MVLHEINQAIRFSDSIIGLKDGNVLAHGNPEEIITSELLEQLYGVKLGVTEIDGHKYVLTVG